MPNLFNVDFLDFLELLNKYKVNYLLVGGYAVIIHGYGRSTGDMDLWIEKTTANYYKLNKAYQDFSAPIFSLEEFEGETLDVWSIGIEPRKIEILTSVTGLTFDESIKKCKYFDIEKFKIPYINFDDLIKNKLSTGRYKDLADVEQLKKIKK